MHTDLIGTGWNFPLRTGPHGGFAMTGGTAKLEQAMRLVLTTYPGERAKQPEFGSRLRDYVFRPVAPNNLAGLAHEVRSALRRWEPRVSITDVEAYPAPDEPRLLYIEIAYTVLATNDPRNLVFPFHTDPDGEVA